MNEYMSQRKQTSSVEEFQTDSFCEYSALNVREHNYSLLKIGLCLVISFKRV